MLAKCATCGKEELLPFTCRYCGKQSCSEHRLPEAHNCLMVGSNVFTMERITDKGSLPVYARPSRFRTSRTELLHLAIGMSVFFIIEAPIFLRFGAQTLFTVAGIIALSYALHELAHKLTAQYYGLWSEFRLNLFGTMISLLTTFSPVKIIAPGAVVVFGSRVTRESMGKIALAGPLANIIQILVFVLLSQFFPILWLAALWNADLAVFNLIPISVLDGRKVFTWNKKVLAATLATALILSAMVRYVI